MKKHTYFFGIILLLLVSCKKERKSVGVTENTSIEQVVLNDTDSFFYIDFKKYPQSDNTLPIGVFDSGTGGLTVLKAIVNFDENENKTFKKGSDGIMDFKSESFTYLGDQANMPYGNYSKEGRVKFLKELIIKDAQFLMSKKYYTDSNDQSYNLDKKPVKVLVIACNTATAYGKENVEAFLKKAGVNIKVIGVIDAGVRGTLKSIKKDEDAIIGVLATAGTVASKGYRNAILKTKEALGYIGKIEIFSQGGVGIAEAVDEDPDYFDRTLTKPRENYKGPDFNGDVKIDKTLFDVYNFDFKGSKMLCDTEKSDDCSILQINDAKNYVRYHLVSIMEQIRLSKTTNKLKSLILGCTHYPYMKQEISEVLEELYNYKEKGGTYLYRNFMTRNIRLIDPAVDTARELYDYLNKEKKFNPEGDIKNSEFYISVANKANPNNQIDENGRFTYKHKYGREAGKTQQYVKIVPFSRKNISNDILERFKKQTPYVYKLIHTFNNKNDKTVVLPQENKI